MRVASLLAVASLITSCNTDTPNGAPCYPGDYVYCACDDGIQGYTRCPTDGSYYGPCDCSGIHPGQLPDAAPIQCIADEAGKLPLYCPCSTSSDCESGDCFLFHAKGPHCTVPCSVQTASQVCLPPSAGCSMMGQCMVQ